MGDDPAARPTTMQTTALSRAVQNWLTALPRWGWTQEDELHDLWKQHGHRVKRSALPAVALGHPQALDALLAAGFTLEQVAVGDAPNLRWVAMLQNAPMEIHARLDGAGVPPLDVDLFLHKGRALADLSLGHSVRYAAKTVPEAFAQAAREGHCLLSLLAVSAWVKHPNKNTKDVLAALLECGLSPEKLRTIGHQVISNLSTNRDSLREKFDRTVTVLHGQTLSGCLPAPALAPRIRL